MNIYDALLFEYSENERRELRRRFFKKHRDFRDSVHVPEVVTWAFVITITTALAVIWEHLAVRFVICIVMIGFSIALRRLFERKMSEVNKRKLEKFLREVSVPAHRRRDYSVRLSTEGRFRRSMSPMVLSSTSAPCSTFSPQLGQHFHLSHSSALSPIPQQ